MVRLKLSFGLVATACLASSSWAKPPTVQPPDGDVWIGSTWVSRTDACSDVQGRLYCPAPPSGQCPQQGNVSNNPRITFDRQPSVEAYDECRFGNDPKRVRNPNFADGSTYHNYCNSRLALCADLRFDPFTVDVPVSELVFEVRRQSSGARSKTRRFPIRRPGTIPGEASGQLPGGAECEAATIKGACGYCVLWDGALEPGFAPTNGRYGFTVSASVRTVNLNLTTTGLYPSSHSRDCSACRAEGQSSLLAPDDSCDPTHSKIFPGLVPELPLTVDLGGYRQPAVSEPPPKPHASDCTENGRTFAGRRKAQLDTINRCYQWGKPWRWADEGKRNPCGAWVLTNNQPGFDHDRFNEYVARLRACNKGRRAEQGWSCCGGGKNLPL